MLSVFTVACTIVILQQVSPGKTELSTLFERQLIANIYREYVSNAKRDDDIIAVLIKDNVLVTSRRTTVKFFVAVPSRAITTIIVDCSDFRDACYKGKFFLRQDCRNLTTIVSMKNVTVQMIDRTWQIFVPSSIPFTVETLCAINIGFELPENLTIVAHSRVHFALLVDTSPNTTSEWLVNQRFNSSAYIVEPNEYTNREDQKLCVNKNANYKMDGMGFLFEWFRADFEDVTFKKQLAAHFAHHSLGNAKFNVTVSAVRPKSACISHCSGSCPLGMMKRTLRCNNQTVGALFCDFIAPLFRNNNQLLQRYLSTDEGSLPRKFNAYPDKLKKTALQSAVHFVTPENWTQSGLYLSTHPLSAEKCCCA